MSKASRLLFFKENLVQIDSSRIKDIYRFAFSLKDNSKHYVADIISARDKNIKIFDKST